MNTALLWQDVTNVTIYVAPCDKKGPMRLTFYKKYGQFVHFPSRDQHDTMRDQWSLINHPVERRDKCDQAAAKRTLPK